MNRRRSYFVHVPKSISASPFIKVICFRGALSEKRAPRKEFNTVGVGGCPNSQIQV
jgi:hypothetical protein